MELRMTVRPQKKYPTIACCGLDCGLCPRYYTEGPSKCPGCAGPAFYEKHPSCGKITCCVMKKGLEVCGECDEFPCAEKYGSWASDGVQYDSFVTYRKVPDNMAFIQGHGVERYVEHQKSRIDLLETMLKCYNDGRSKNFYCIAATLLPTEDIEAALEETEKRVEADSMSKEDSKILSSTLKKLLKDIAMKQGVELKLRKV